MIRVTVELIPYGTGTPRKLGELRIANVGGTRTRGNYLWRLFGKEGAEMGTGRIENWPRLQRHVWDLVARAIAHRASRITLDSVTGSLLEC